MQSIWRTTNIRIVEIQIYVHSEVACLRWSGSFLAEGSLRTIQEITYRSEFVARLAVDAPDHEVNSGDSGKLQQGAASTDDHVRRIEICRQIDNKHSSLCKKGLLRSERLECNNKLL